MVNGIFTVMWRFCGKRYIFYVRSLWEAIYLLLCDVSVLNYIFTVMWNEKNNFWQSKINVQLIGGNFTLYRSKLVIVCSSAGASRKSFAPSRTQCWKHLCCRSSQDRWPSTPKRERKRNRERNEERGPPVLLGDFMTPWHMLWILMQSSYQ